MRKLIFIPLLIFCFYGLSYAATTGRISDNVNGMRQLTDANIVRQYPGAAPYYGPSNCQQQLSNFQGQMGPGYSCACPDLNANPVCTPICSVLQPQYQQQAGPQYSCTCPAPNVTPVCTKLNCGQLLTQYQMQYPYPQYSCQCAAGSGSSTTPTCTANPTCSQLLPQVQAGYGQNYACSCPTCSGGNDPNCYAGPSCTAIVKSCSFNLNNTTKYNTTWTCTGTQTGNNISYTCTDGSTASASAGGSIGGAYYYTGSLYPGQCQSWNVPWISCQQWITDAPPNGCPTPNSCACGTRGAWACAYNYNPYGTVGGTYMNSVADSQCGSANASIWGIAFNVICWNGNSLSFTAADSEVFSSACITN